MSDSLALPGELAPGEKEVKNLVDGDEGRGTGWSHAGRPWGRSLADRSAPVQCCPRLGPGSVGGWSAGQAPSSLALSGED